MSDQETQMPVPLHAHLPENAPDLLNWVDLQTDDLRVRVLNYGAVTAHCDLWSGAEWVPMILGYQDMQSYLGDPFYLGAIVGRVANRVGAAQMKLGGQVVHLEPNEGQNQLHGGAQGLGRVFWELDQVTARSARLRHVSLHGANGYPGEAEFVVTIALQGRTVTYDMTVTVDRPTPSILLSTIITPWATVLGSGSTSCDRTRGNICSWMPMVCQRGISVMWKAPATTFAAASALPGSILNGGGATYM